MVENKPTLSELAQVGETSTEIVTRSGTIFGMPVRLQGFEDFESVEVPLFGRDLAILDERLNPDSIYTSYIQAMLVYEKGKLILAIIDNGLQLSAARRQQAVLELRPKNDIVYARKRDTFHPIINSGNYWEAGFNLSDLIEARVDNPYQGLLIIKKPNSELKDGVVGDGYYVDASGILID